MHGRPPWLTVPWSFLNSGHFLLGQHLPFWLQLMDATQTPFFSSRSSFYFTSFLLPGSHIYLTHFSQVINEQLLILLFSYQEMQLFSSFIFSFSWPLGAAGGGGAHFPQPKTYQEIFLTQLSPLLWIMPLACESCSVSLRSDPHLFFPFLFLPTLYNGFRNHSFFCSVRKLIL